MTKKLIFITTFISFVAALLIGLPVTAHAESPNIKPTQDYVVNDYANILSDKTKALIHQKEKFYESKQEQPQVVVLTIKSTDGKSLYDWTNELVQQSDWHFGNREYRNAVLIVFAKNNGKNNVQIKAAAGLNQTLNHDEIMRLLHNNQNALKSQDTAKIDSGIYNLFSDTTNAIDTLYGYNKTNDDSKLEAIVLTALAFALFFGPGIIILVLTIKRNKNTYNYTTTYNDDDSSSSFLSGLFLGSMFNSNDDYQNDDDSGSMFDGSSFGSDDSFDSSGDDGGGFDGGDSGDF